MLSYLGIKNFGIFEEVSLTLGSGLSVFTGETGAGKSMIVDAVLSAMGSRTPKGLVMKGREKAYIELVAEKPKQIMSLAKDEPVFLATKDSPEIFLTRDIFKDRSFVRVNGRVQTMALAQEIGGFLVDIHGQQENHSLLKPQRYVSILDSLCKEKIEPLKSHFRELFVKRQALLRERVELSKDEKENLREIDLLSFQVQEIKDAKIQIGEENALKEEYRRLSSMTRLIKMCQDVRELIYDGGATYKSAWEILNGAWAILQKVQNIDPLAKNCLKAIEETVFSLEAAVDIFRSYSANLSFDSQRYEEVASRLDLLEKLKSKYGSTLEAVLEYGCSAEERLDRLLRAEEIKKVLEKDLEALEAEMASLGENIHEIRKDVSCAMSVDVAKTLVDLGMPNAFFNVLLEKDVDESSDFLDKEGKRLAVKEDGFDRADFLFGANLGIAPSPLNKVASGGELSRVMLALKAYMAKVDPVPTLIFDEIDAGIGGRAGQKVAEKLGALAKDRQILCVTHLASIAAMADNHYVIEKTEEGGATNTSVRLVTGEDKVKEIARMLSGTQSAASLENAKAMVDAAQKIKNC